MCSAIQMWTWIQKTSDLEEFADEIDSDVIDKLKAIGCDAAKSVFRTKTMRN